MIGLVMPTNGTAYIDGMDLRKDMNEIYACIGVCPQHEYGDKLLVQHCSLKVNFSVVQCQTKKNSLQHVQSTLGVSNRKGAPIVLRSNEESHRCHFNKGHLKPRTTMNLIKYNHMIPI